MATALDVSIGAIQHYFSTMAEMMAFAFDDTVERTLPRVASLELRGDRAVDLASVLRQLLPLDETRRREAAIHLAFASLAATTPSLQSIQRSLLDNIRTELVDVLGEDRDTEAAMLLAVVDGLALHAISAPDGLRPDQLEAALGLAINAALHQRQTRPG